MQSFFLFFFWKWPTLIYRGQEMTKRMNTEGITMVSSMGRFRKRTTWRQDARECILSPCVLFYYTIVVVHYGFQEVEKKKKILRKEKNCCPWMETVWKTFLLFETSILLMIPQKINWRKKCAIETVKWAVCVDFYHPYYHWRINVENGDFFCSKKKKKWKSHFGGQSSPYMMA